MKIFTVLIVIGSLVIAVGRLFTPWRGPSLAMSYEALAHVFVGGLVGVWLVGITYRCNRLTLPRIPWRLCGWSALALSGWELFAFLMGIGKL